MARRPRKHDPEEVLAYVVDNFDHRDKLSLARRLRDRLDLTQDASYVSQVRQKIGRPLVSREEFVIRALEEQIRLAYPDYAYGGGIRIGRVLALRKNKTAVRMASRRTVKRAAKKTAKRAAKKAVKRAAKKTAKRTAKKAVKRAAKKTAKRAARKSARR
jgi:hypothetical protein